MKRHGSRWLVVGLVLLVAPLLVTACGSTAANEDATPPAVTEQATGTDVIRVKLTAAAAERIGLRTVDVRSDGPGTNRTVVPYGAVLYDPNGDTWIYTSPRRLVFQREDVSVDRIEGDTAILTKGPPVGTPVVTNGATEIWGVEYGGIEED